MPYSCILVFSCLFLLLGLVLQLLHRTLVGPTLPQHHHIQDHPEGIINITTEIFEFEVLLSVCDSDDNNLQNEWRCGNKRISYFNPHRSCLIYVWNKPKLTGGPGGPFCPGGPGAPMGTSPYRGQTAAHVLFTVLAKLESCSRNTFSQTSITCWAGRPGPCVTAAGTFSTWPYLLMMFSEVEEGYLLEDLEDLENHSGLLHLEPPPFRPDLTGLSGLLGHAFHAFPEAPAHPCPLPRGKQTFIQTSSDIQPCVWALSQHPVNYFTNLSVNSISAPISPHFFNYLPQRQTCHSLTIRIPAHLSFRALRSISSL